MLTFFKIVMWTLFLILMIRLLPDNSRTVRDQYIIDSEKRENLLKTITVESDSTANMKFDDLIKRNTQLKQRLNRRKVTH